MAAVIVMHLHNPHFEDKDEATSGQCTQKHNLISFISFHFLFMSSIYTVLDRFSSYVVLSITTLGWNQSKQNIDLSGELFLYARQSLQIVRLEDMEFRVRPNRRVDRNGAIFPQIFCVGSVLRLTSRVDPECFL